MLKIKLIGKFIIMVLGLKPKQVQLLLDMSSATMFQRLFAPVNNDVDDDVSSSAYESAEINADADSTDTEDDHDDPTVNVVTLGGRTIELIPFCDSDELSIFGGEMVQRAHQLKARSGRDLAFHVLEYQMDLPESLRQYCLVFTEWRQAGNLQSIALLEHREGLWGKNFQSIESPWSKICLLVREVQQN